MRVMIQSRAEFASGALQASLPHKETPRFAHSKVRSALSANIDETLTDSDISEQGGGGFSDGQRDEDYGAFPAGSDRRAWRWRGHDAREWTG